MNSSEMGKLSWERRKAKFGEQALKDKMRSAGEKGRASRYSKNDIEVTS